MPSPASFATANNWGYAVGTSVSACQRPTLNCMSVDALHTSLPGLIPDSSPAFAMYSDVPFNQRLQENLNQHFRGDASTHVHPGNPPPFVDRTRGMTASWLPESPHPFPQGQLIQSRWMPEYEANLEVAHVSSRPGAVFTRPHIMSHQQNSVPGEQNCMEASQVGPQTNIVVEAPSQCPANFHSFNMQALGTLVPSQQCSSAAYHAVQVPDLSRRSWISLPQASAPYGEY